MDDDLTLVRRAQRGEGAAFELLVRRHTDRLWRVARSLSPDDQTAEEIVQDTFVKAHRSLGRFRGDSSIETWLHVICHRTALDRHRRPRLEVQPLDEVQREPSSQPSDARMIVEEAIGGLEVDERAAFTLVAVLGYRSEEAADVIGVPASTVRSRVARARRRLAEALVDGTEVLA